MFESLGLLQVAFMALSWYWMIGLVVFGLWFIGCVFEESFEIGAVMLVLFLGLTQFSGFYDFRAIDFVSLFYTGAIYLAVGCIWSLFKYKITAKDIAKEYIDEYPRKSGNELREGILNRIEARIYKSKISGWIVFFPFSILKFLFGDFIDYLVSKLGKVYKRIAVYVTESVISSSIKVNSQTKD